MRNILGSNVIDDISEVWIRKFCVLNILSIRRIFQLYWYIICCGNQFYWWWKKELWEKIISRL